MTKAVSVLVVLVAVIVLTTFAVTYKRWEGQAPDVAFNRDFKALGMAPSLGLTVQDTGTGLRQVTIRLKQKDHDVLLADESFPRSVAQKQRTYEVGKLIAAKYKIEEGPASLDVTASDFALRRFLRGNRTEVVRDFEFDIKPPQLE